MIPALCACDQPGAAYHIWAELRAKDRSAATLTSSPYRPDPVSASAYLATEYSGRETSEPPPPPRKLLPSDSDNLDRPVADLDLSVRSASCLRTAEIRFVGEIVQKTEREMLLLKNFGRKSVREVKEILGDMDLQLGMDTGEWAPPT